MPKPIHFVEKEINGRRFVEIKYNQKYVPIQFSAQAFVSELEPQPVVNGFVHEVGKSESPDILSPLEPKKNSKPVVNSSPHRCGDTTKIIRLKFIDGPKRLPRTIYVKRKYELDVKQINAIMTILPCKFAEIEWFLFKRNATSLESRGLLTALKRMAVYSHSDYKWSLK